MGKSRNTHTKNFFSSFFVVEQIMYLILYSFNEDRTEQMVFLAYFLNFYSRSNLKSEKLFKASFVKNRTSKYQYENI